MDKRMILVVEDDQDWSDIVAKDVGKVLNEMNRKWSDIATGDIGKVLNKMDSNIEFVIVRARTFIEASEALKNNRFFLVSMDINLSGGTKGKSEGLDLLAELVERNPDAWSIIVSAEGDPQYYKAGYQRYHILRFIEKSPWNSNELKMTVKSIVLYMDARRHIEQQAWAQAIKTWREACEAFPDLKHRFQDIETLVEKATMNPTTGLPAGRAIDMKLASLLQSGREWGILYVLVNNMKEYIAAYGYVAGNAALSAIGKFLQSQISDKSFIGQVEDTLFILIVENRAVAASLEKGFLDSFGPKMNAHLYQYQDRERGHIETSGRKYLIPILTLTTRKVSDEDGPFTDIREISMKGPANFSS